jgi:copper(I)-binding protein
MHRWLATLAGVVLFASAATAQTGMAQTGTAQTGMAQTGGVEVRNAWARGTPAGAENGAAYLTLQSPVIDRLTGVSTPVAKKAELHTMRMEGGIMKMRGLDSIDLPAGQPVTLKPGGAHIMLFDLNRPLRAGETFPLTLQFASGGKREVQVEIEKPGAMGPAAGAAAQPTGAMPMPARQ